MLIQNGTVFCPDKSFVKADVSIGGGVISEIASGLTGSDVLDASGCYVIPGLVDVHTHGALGKDFSDGIADDLPALSRWYAARGTTAFLATTMTLQEPELTAAMHCLRDFYPPDDGAACAGVHLEGPFLSYAKRGAQAAENLHVPDAAMFHRLNAASGGQVHLVTVAPEEAGAIPFIQEVSRTCAVSLGHTSADYDQASAAYEAGASRATHLFNAMPPLLHRTPGVIGAAFDHNAWAELICDGLHVHPSAVRCAFRLFGSRLALVSDSLRCAGMPDGNYTLGGQPIVMKDGRATLLDGTLAGSSITMLEALRNAVRFGIALEDAVYAATAAPAASVGLDSRFGILDAGRQADLLILDQALNLRHVILRGRLLGEAAG